MESRHAAIERASLRSGITTDTIGQSMIFYQGLKDRGVSTRFLRFPREPHGFREPHHQRIRDLEEIAWFEKYVRCKDFKVETRK